MRFFLPLVGLLPHVLLAATTHAAITYVDAEGRFAGVGNTTVNGADISLGTNIGPSGGGDHFWYIRPNGDGTAAPIFNGIDGWEVDTSSTVFEATEPLVTTISGLTAGETYNLYGFFWAHTNENQYYDVAFRVGSTGSFSEFDKLNTTAAAAADFTNSEMALQTLAGGWILRTAFLGQHTPTGDAVEIYVQGPDRDLSAYDPLPNGFNATTNPNAAQRTEYDGVGYELQ